VAYVRPNGSDASDIFVAPVGRPGRTRLTTTGDASTPVWSPDGRTIAFARLTPFAVDPADGRPIRGGVSIWAMAADGSTSRSLAAEEHLVFKLPGSWSPDGSLLAFTRCPLVLPDARGLIRDEGCAIDVIAPDGTGVRRITDAGRSPDFSSDGSRIAFASNRDRWGIVRAGADENRYADELYVMNADGSEQKRLTRTGRLSEGSPRFAPDGSRLVFTRQRHGFALDLVQMNADGSCVRIVAPARAQQSVGYRAPDWWPRPGAAGPGPLSCGGR
jgi:Tol biopolymer transport system component